MDGLSEMNGQGRPFPERGREAPSVTAPPREWERDSFRDGPSKRERQALLGTAPPREKEREALSGTVPPRDREREALSGTVPPRETEALSGTVPPREREALSGTGDCPSESKRERGPVRDWGLSLRE